MAELSRPGSSMPGTCSNGQRAQEIAEKKAKPLWASTRRERAAARDADQVSAKKRKLPIPTSGEEMPAPSESDGGTESSDHDADMAARQARRRRTKHRRTRRKYGAAKRRRSAHPKTQPNEDADKRDDHDDEKHNFLSSHFREASTEERPATLNEELEDGSFISTSASGPPTERVTEVSSIVEHAKGDEETKKTSKSDVTTPELCTNGVPLPTEVAEVKSAGLILLATTTGSSSAGAVPRINGDIKIATKEVRKADQPHTQNHYVRNVDPNNSSSVDCPLAIIEPVKMINGKEKHLPTIGEVSRTLTKQMKEMDNQVEAMMGSGPSTSSFVNSGAKQVDFSSDDADNEMSDEEEYMEDKESHKSVVAGSSMATSTSALVPDQKEASSNGKCAIEESVSCVGGSENASLSQLLQATQTSETSCGITMLAEAAEGAAPAGYLCQLCSKTYPVPSSLQRHMKRVHSKLTTSSNDGSAAAKPPPKCSFCNAVLPVPATQLVRRRHLRTECESNPYTCHQCGRVFISPGGLQQHLAQHDGKQPFQCGVCDIEFTRESHLKIHMSVHTEHKLCRSENVQCKKAYSEPQVSFHSPELVHQGRRAKRKRTLDAPYLANPKCAYCDDRFVSRAQRDQHARQCTYNPYRCAVCGKACLGMVKLERHIRSHSRSRVSSLKTEELAKKKAHSPDPKCAYCNVRFSTRVVRDRHSRMCDKNPYRCSVCSKAFLGTAKLVRHLRCHTEGGTEYSEKESSVEDAGDDEQDTLIWLVDGCTTTCQEAAQLTEENKFPGAGAFLPPTTRTAPLPAMTSESGTPVDVGTESSGTANNSVASSSMTSLVGSTVMAANGNPGVLMASGNQPMIAVPTPLSYSFVPTTFSSMPQPTMSIVTTSKSQQEMSSESFQMGLQPVTVTMATSDGTDSSMQKTATYLAPVGYPLQPYLQTIPVNNETDQQTQQLLTPTASNGSGASQSAFQPVKHSQVEVANTTPIQADTSIQLVLPMQASFQTVPAAKVESSGRAQRSQSQQTEMQVPQVQQIVHLQPQQMLQLQAQPMVQQVQTSAPVQILQGVMQMQPVESEQLLQPVQTSQALQIVQPMQTAQCIQSVQVTAQVLPAQAGQQLQLFQPLQAVPAQTGQPTVLSPLQGQPLQSVPHEEHLQSLPPTSDQSSVPLSSQKMLHVPVHPAEWEAGQQQQLSEVQSSNQPSVLEWSGSQPVVEENDKTQLGVFHLNNELLNTVEAPIPQQVVLPAHERETGILVPAAQHSEHTAPASVELQHDNQAQYRQL